MIIFMILVVKETNNDAADLFLSRSSDKSRINAWVDVDKKLIKNIFWITLSHRNY